ncbi:MAG: hypothetical protein ABEJ26_06150 [Halosimplex sp.]
MNERSRRELLLATGAAAATGIGGCVIRRSGPGTGHIYVENTGTATHTVALWVAPHADDAEPVVAAWYRVREGYALAFEEVIESDRAYEVRAALRDASPSDRVTDVVRPCSGDASGERVISVRTRTDGLGIISWGCEKSYSKEDLNYVDAAEHRVEAVEGTVADP